MRTKDGTTLCAAAAAAVFLLSAPQTSAASQPCPKDLAITYNSQDTDVTRLRYAAQEIARYAKTLFGLDWQVVDTSSPRSPHAPTLALASLHGPAGLNAVDGFTITPSPNRATNIRGNNGRSVLYGAYELIRQWGVQFYLSGDVLPSHPVCSLPTQIIARQATLQLRGAHPYPDFLAGPTSWDAPQFDAYLKQIPKLGLNFFGIHQYTYESYLDYTVDGVHPRSGHLETSATPEWGYGGVSTCDFEIGRHLFESCV